MVIETTEGRQMGPKYNPFDVETRWYETWESEGLFQPDLESEAPAFVITIPPPNVTGDLHLGHVITFGIEDVIGRFKRMQGFNTFIVPGLDHAAIATQNVIEKQLAKEGLTRHDVGRDKFLERVWDWTNRYKHNIRSSFQALGCGFDWSHERFTMDSGYVDAVLEFFIRLYEEGKIYRGWRVINWCPRCQSAISDIEVKDEEREDRLYYLRYPLEDGTGEIMVSTVRPETILGDVAVAVNPDDSRYSGLIGKKALLPLLNRELEIIADPMVDMNFGTGAVKITPAHDFADFEVAERHPALKRPIAISADGRITELGGRYEGQTVGEARRTVLKDLESGGFLIKEEPYSHSVPTCDRCGTLLEPLLSEQWFMEMKELAQPAIDVVKDGQISFVPERWGRIYLDWMENIRPWTLSRQLWWGHRIPIYYCQNGHTTAAKSWPEACSTCGSPIDHQDPDVLDTWFSSALWPFAVLGWPEETRLLEKFYPTSFMNTSSQILYLWIARMIMTGLKFMGKIPFPVVLISPTILNVKGQRMSRSLGTGTDPTELMSEFGADALRFGVITSGSTHQQEIRFSAERVELARNLGNKIWNIARFIVEAQEEEPERELHLTLPDKWILSRLNRTIESVTQDLERYEFSGAGQTAADFARAEFADWYLEMAKLRLTNGEASAGFTARAVLWSVLDRLLRLVHPYMPFLTEDIWQHLRKTGSKAARDLSGWREDLPARIMVAPWPTRGEPDERSEQEMELVMELIKLVRTTRSEYRVEPGKFVPGTIVAGEAMSVLQGDFEVISRLARLEPLAVYEVMPDKPSKVVSLMVGDVTVYLPLSGLTDVEGERKRLSKELIESRSGLEQVKAKLSNESFTSRAPENVVSRERERARGLNERIRRLEERLDLLEE